MDPATYIGALKILRDVDYQMLSRDALHKRGVTDDTIDAAIAKGDVCGDSGRFASIVLTVDGETFLAGVP